MLSKEFSSSSINCINVDLGCIYVYTSSLKVFSDFEVEREKVVCQPFLFTCKSSLPVPLHCPR